MPTFNVNRAKTHTHTKKNWKYYGAGTLVHPKEQSNPSERFQASWKRVNFQQQQQQQWIQGSSMGGNWKHKRSIQNKEERQPSLVYTDS